MDEHDAEMDSERNETPAEIAVIVEQWRVARSHFRDNNDQGRFEPLAMQIEHSGGDWLLTLLAERERLVKVVEAARVLAQQPYFCGQVLTQALLDAQHYPEYAAVVRDCLRDYDLLRKAFAELEGQL